MGMAAGLSVAFVLVSLSSRGHHQLTYRSLQRYDSVDRLHGDDMKRELDRLAHEQEGKEFHQQEDSHMHHGGSHCRDVTFGYIVG